MPNKTETEARADIPCRYLLDDLDILKAVMLNAPELNPSNYDHQQVCELNTAMCEAYSILTKIIEEHFPSNASGQGMGGAQPRTFPAPNCSE